MTAALTAASVACEERRRRNEFGRILACYAGSIRTSIFGCLRYIAEMFLGAQVTFLILYALPVVFVVCSLSGCGYACCFCVKGSPAL